MNFGNTVCELRKRKGVTQEELAAELGVTAAAVSKWEKGYSLPDLLMLCALADYFDVSADLLLGRSRQTKYAVVAAGTRELGDRIRVLAEQYGIVTKGVFENRDDASAAIREDPEISCLIMGFPGSHLPELSLDLGGRTISLYLSIGSTEQDILSALRNSLSNQS